MDGDPAGMRMLLPGGGPGVCGSPGMLGGEQPRLSYRDCNTPSQHSPRCVTARGRSSENIICLCTWSSQERMDAAEERALFLLSHGVGTSGLCQMRHSKLLFFSKAYFSWLIVWECNCTEKYLVSVLIFPSGAHSMNTQKSFRKRQVHEPCPWTSSKSGSVPSLWQFALRKLQCLPHACSPNQELEPFLSQEQRGQIPRTAGAREVATSASLPVTGNWKAKVRRKYNCIWIPVHENADSPQRLLSYSFILNIFRPWGRRLID